MRSKPLFVARRIVAVAAFVLAMVAGGSAAASASPAPAHSAGVHLATTMSPSTAIPPGGGGWYPNAQCTVWQDGWEIVSPYTGEIWQCGYRDGQWKWYPTGRYVV
jgi:hypothetical protein